MLWTNLRGQEYVFILSFKSGIDESIEWSMIPVCPSLMCFFFFQTGAIPKGLILQTKLCLMFVFFSLVQICVRTDFVVFGEFVA